MVGGAVQHASLEVLESGAMTLRKQTEGHEEGVDACVRRVDGLMDECVPWVTGMRRACMVVLDDAGVNGMMDARDRWANCELK